MKRLDVLVPCLFVVMLVVVGVVSANRLPADTTGFFTAQTVGIAEDAPFGVRLGIPTKEAVVQLNKRWPDTHCSGTGDKLDCFNTVDFSTTQVVVVWHFNKTLKGVVAITDTPNFGAIFSALNRLYGKPSQAAEKGDHKMYRWSSSQSQVVVGLDSAYENDGETYVIFSVLLYEPEPKRDPAIVDF